MFTSAILMLAGSAFLLTPPTPVSWGYAELLPIGGAEQRALARGVSDVTVFSAAASQFVTDGLSDEQRDAYDNAVARIEDEWEEASARDRARLLLKLRELGSVKNTRSIEQTWVMFDGMLVHYLEVLDMQTGGLLLKLEDLTTGQYVAVLSQREGEFDPNAAILRLFELGLEGEELQAVFREAMREDGGTNHDVNQEAVKIFKQMKDASMETTVRIEVNGVVRLLDGDQRPFHGYGQEVVGELWPNLPEGEGRTRIESAVAVIRRLVEHEAALKEKMVAGKIVGLTSPLDEVPEDACLSEGSKVVGFRSGGSMMTLDAPPKEVLDEFFGERGMPLPDPDWSFKRLKKELL